MKKRRVLAREIHDDIAQSLLAIKSKVATISASNTRNEIILQIKKALSNIRQLVKNIYPQQLEKLGLSNSIKSAFGETLLPLDIRFEFETNYISRSIDKDSELQFFRIAQEALNNIVKHSKAGVVKVSLTHQSECLTLIIEDDGLGVNNSDDEGIGLLNIRERAELINAELRISNRSQTGTRVEMTLACP